MINNIGHLETPSLPDKTKKYTVVHFFAGIGGGALGMQKSMVEYRGLLGKFETIVGIDCDREACQDFEMITGVPAACIDLFSRKDYIAYHGHEPPLGWQEATAEDIRNATRGIYPSVIFMSPPCKGFSGLLPEKTSKTEKYQALNRLTIRGLELIFELSNTPIWVTPVLSESKELTLT
ncbi:hypothetical protein Dtox_2452 [Desulfofarcimen acetoxidans DSM 771]|uniref:DNA (cytosine-5-)-methyltransferase n=1 Tax=Desulfofarcimen acetoxidans (strain ATCC 49208 / DSM 771 / KCTC 5769 / VKM B-1644 / 5575) TaxID=485916 RepID=C8W0K6_DESAS|nr:hypothetical protein [Desulfofarcimen acetoxidans]ACV63261.1 hypothetical protein Dtox_2452 [Desulfofarcimen acetoxidans DSM 771]